ncbi:MAG: hypothetical protein R3F30_04135 [Planctomycetota bacterium]
MRLTTILVLLALCLPACKNSSTTEAGASRSMGSGTMAADYYEVPKDGRIYVLGSEASMTHFRETGHLPYTKTLIGAGPNGETVVFEAEAKDTALQERLMAGWHDRH